MANMHLPPEEGDGPHPFRRRYGIYTHNEALNPSIEILGQAVSPNTWQPLGDNEEVEFMETALHDSDSDGSRDAVEGAPPAIPPRRRPMTQSVASLPGRTRDEQDYASGFTMAAESSVHSQPRERPRNTEHLAYGIPQHGHEPSTARDAPSTAGPRGSSSLAQASTLPDSSGRSHAVQPRAGIIFPPSAWIPLGDPSL